MSSSRTRRRRLFAERSWWFLWGGLWLASYAVALFQEVVRCDWEETVNGNLARGIVEGLIVSP